MTSVRCPALLLAASSLVLSACLDLGLPNVPPDGGVGPELTIQSPREGDTIALNAPVSVDAASINGVSSVTVTCGGAPSTGVFTWSVAPYTGVVDFTRCTLVTAGVNDAGIGQLKLTFIGVDFQGHQSSKSVNVFLDTTTAS
ncbi:MAG: Ig-like domain-containing protein, partial [Myxococcaceae bacterium]